MFVDELEGVWVGVEGGAKFCEHTVDALVVEGVFKLQRQLEEALADGCL